jgi:hypothetical protein
MIMPLAESYPNIPAAVDSLAVEAGDDPGKAASLLADVKASGVCGDADRCVLADWLGKVVLNVSNVSIQPGGEPPCVYWLEWDDDGSENIRTYDLPPVLDTMAMMFDEQMYPALIYQGDLELFEPAG